VVTGLTSTHKNWWECDTGIAYLVSGDLAKADPLQLGPSGWRTWRMTKIYDLSDPAKPVFIRDFGLAGQEPGSTGPMPAKDRVRDFVFLVSEAIANECRESRHASFVVDITAETRPFGVATFQVPESKGRFCTRGGRFGPHSSSESFAPIFYRKLVFVAYFN